MSVSLVFRLNFMMYYICRPRGDNQLFPRNGNDKYPPIPLPWLTKNENTMIDNAYKAKVEGVSESKLFNKTAYN